MSWKEYVETFLMASNCIKKACIASHDGEIWASSDDFPVTKDELIQIEKGFRNEKCLISNGITVCGIRYIYLSRGDNVLRGKYGRGGVHCVKTNQTIILTVYEEPVQPQQVAAIAERLGDHLVSFQF